MVMGTARAAVAKAGNAKASFTETGSAFDLSIAAGSTGRSSASDSELNDRPRPREKLQADAAAAQSFDQPRSPSQWSLADSRGNSRALFPIPFLEFCN
jgi:hypothetical protein